VEAWQVGESFPENFSTRTKTKTKIKRSEKEAFLSKKVS